MSFALAGQIDALIAKARRDGIAEGLRAARTLREVGEILECTIEGTASNDSTPTRLRRVEGIYDYYSGSLTCPVCGSIGMVWGGLFHCEAQPHKAVIATGQCFEVVSP